MERATSTESKESPIHVAPHHRRAMRRLVPQFALRAYRHIPRPVEINPWFDGIGRGTFPNAAHQVQRAIRDARAPKEACLEGGFRPTPSETVGYLRAASDGLPTGQKAVVTLRDVEGWSAEGVCNTLEISESNQRVLLHRDTSRVRRALEQYFAGN